MSANLRVFSIVFCNNDTMKKKWLLTAGDVWNLTAPINALNLPRDFWFQNRYAIVNHIFQRFHCELHILRELNDCNELMIGYEVSTVIKSIDLIHCL